MKTLFFLSIIFCSITVIAQESNQPTYLRFPTIPPFELLSVDSTTTITKADLKKNQPLMLMFFSPDCDHCQHQMQDMLKEMESFKKIQIIMATYQPFNMMKDFYHKYGLSNYSNIRVGRDTKYFLPPYYQMMNLPYLALYDKKGNLITTFAGNQKVPVILKAFGKDED